MGLQTSNDLVKCALKYREKKVVLFFAQKQSRRGFVFARFIIPIPISLSQAFPDSSPPFFSIFLPPILFAM
jgi:hypothetical protein